MHLKSTETEVVEQARRARAKKRALADKYATVPAVRGNVADTPDTALLPWMTVRTPGTYARPTPTTSPARTSSVSEEALGKGRVAPAATRPVSQSSSAGRQQPTRQSKSKRGKK